MNITFVVASLDFSGGCRVIATYASRFAALGHRVQVLEVLSPGERTWWFRLRSHFRNEGRHFLTGRHPSHIDGLEGERLTVKTLRRALRPEDCQDADAIIATWWETAAWVAALPASKGRKFYFVQHHEIFASPVDQVHASYRLPLRKIVIAPWLQQVMVDQYGVHDAVLIENAVDLTLFHAPARVRNARFTVGFMYASASFKAMPVLFDALGQLRRAGAAFQAVAFGRHRFTVPTEFENCLSYIQQPSAEQIRACYAAADVWLSSSTSEGFNLPALEAMACGTPVVSTRTGWPAYAIRDGYNGWGVDIGDAAGMARAVSALAALSPAAWKTVSDNALATATKHSWEAATEQFLAALSAPATEPVVLADR